MPDNSSRPTAVVSGSATGIGAACARHLAAAGLNVAINYTKSAAEAEATAEACRALGVEALVIRGDVGEDADCRALAAAALEAWGGLDVLVNNAGTTRFADAGDLDSLTKDDFAQIFAVNVTGAYQLTRAAAPHLKAAGGAERCVATPQRSRFHRRAVALSEPRVPLQTCPDTGGRSGVATPGTPQTAARRRRSHDRGDASG